MTLRSRLARLEGVRPPVATSILADGTIWDLLCGRRRNYTQEQLAEWAAIAERLQRRRRGPHPIEEMIRAVGLTAPGAGKDGR
jgi:hypothetical protein